VRTRDREDGIEVGGEGGGCPPRGTCGREHFVQEGAAAGVGEGADGVAIEVEEVEDDQRRRMLDGQPRG
jgi:hypothetical protein